MTIARPNPPSSLLELSELSDFGIRLTPAPEVWEWLQAEILSDTGSIHNEDHAHLIDADVRVMQKRGQIYFYFAALRVFIEWIRLDQLAAD